MLGALLALASAAMFGMNNAAVRRGVLTGSVLQAMMITVPIGVPLFALASLPFGGWQILLEMSSAAWFWMALAGVVHFVIGRFSNYRSIQAMGANLSSPVQQLSVPISIILAIAFLDESLTPMRIFGFLLVMVGPAIMMRQKKAGKEQKTRSGFKPNYAEGFFWGIISALAYGASPFFIMKGLGSAGGVVMSLVGGMISYGVAAIVVILLVIRIEGPDTLSRLDGTAKKWFIASGFFVFLSQMFRYMSFALAPVSVAVPIQRLSPVFRVIFGWLLNRDHEFFGFWVISGIVISMLGAIMLALSTDMVISLFPATWEPFLRVEWP